MADLHPRLAEQLACHLDAPDPDALPPDWRAVLEAVSEVYRQNDAWAEQIRSDAYHDRLTGLPNRLLFKDRLGQALGQAKRNGRALAVYFLDLDRFKTISDSLGHSVGDRLLKEVGRRLLARQRGGDTVARWGGDEFLVLTQNLRHPEDVAKVAEGIRSALKPRFRVGHHELHVTASIGIGLFPHDADSVDLLIKNADVAMYRAKLEGRDRYEIFAPEMNARALHILTIENGLRRALEEHELVVHYQPQVDVSSGRPAAVEALVRWRRDGGLEAPDHFISVAEESGQIAELSEWVLATACREARDWQAGGVPVRLAVNLSAQHFQHRRFVESILEILESTGFDPWRLELELTESALLADPERAIEQLGALRERGVRLAVDDFGTGHSSLAYLKRLPVDVLKIDRSFIRDCQDEQKDRAIVGAIIDLAHSLDLRVVGEGVETVEQAAFLNVRGCDSMQGFFFSPPLAAEELAGRLREGFSVPIG